MGWKYPVVWYQVLTRCLQCPAGTREIHWLGRKSTGNRTERTAERRSGDRGAFYGGRDRFILAPGRTAAALDRHFRHPSRRPAPTAPTSPRQPFQTQNRLFDLLALFF